MNLSLLLALVLLLVVAFMFWNPAGLVVPLGGYGSALDLRTLAFLVLVPLVLGLLVGFWIGWSRGRRNIKPKP